MFKNIISKLYHKYVCKPEINNGLFLEEYLELCKEEYELRKYYDIKTFEQLQAIKDIVKVNCSMKKFAQELKEKEVEEPVFIGSPVDAEKFHKYFIEAIPKGRQ